ncbi:uncharacterized protein LOC135963308 [Calliphora vicina]|uniref:uncharacterized protein LOC135963308 n=1 Tax=Calliphora vicina TaxID=7373 RepID=UPI00325BAC6E
METKDLDNFSEIRLDCKSESHSDTETESDAESHSDSEYHNDRTTPQRIPLEPVDFEKYVHENYEDKIKILNRSTFQQIPKPIIISFNHFREKCAYHTKYLDRLHELCLKYGDRIEFIAADIFDIDILKYKRISIEFFYDENPENVIPTIFAIDEQKRVHELNYTEEQSLENLSNLCENLLNGSLFKSQPLPVTDKVSHVKICVHDNYKELVTNYMKHILLIVNHTDYDELNMEDGDKYEAVAEQLAAYNVDVVYINGDKNYLPYELGIVCYTTMIIIPPDDKTDFLTHPIIGPETQENIINCIIAYKKDRKTYMELKQKELGNVWYHPLTITPDLNIDLKDLQQYLQDNCGPCLNVFERETFQTCKEPIIIAFMDFQNGKCLADHMKWIDQIYQVAINLAEQREYFIADFKDIDVINSQWKPQDFSETMAPKVFGLDSNKNKFVMKEFKNAASLFYFAYNLSAGYLGEEEMVNSSN